MTIQAAVEVLFNLIYVVVNRLELFIFDSYYTLEGNVLTVTADEHYRESIVAPEIFEAYRTVINSAADFNKVTLVLEPK